MKWDRKAFKRGYDAPWRSLWELIRFAVTMPSDTVVMTRTFGKNYFPDYSERCNAWAQEYAKNNSLTYVRKYATFEGERLITYRVIFKRD